MKELRSGENTTLKVQKEYQGYADFENLQAFPSFCGASSTAVHAQAGLQGVGTSSHHYK